MPASAELTLLALFLAVAIAVPLGITAAMRPGSPVDQLCRIITTAGVSLPTFFTGLLLVYVFYYLIGIAPAPLGRLDVYSSAPPHHTGFYLIDSLLAGDFETFRAALAQLILPAATMAIFTLAPLARITRAAMLGALGSEFVRTAKASGLARRQDRSGLCISQCGTAGHHHARRWCFRFCSAPMFWWRKVFAWPGIGSYAVDAVIASDYAPVQGFVLAMALLYVLLNLVVDLAYGFVDPRVRLEA